MALVQYVVLVPQYISEGLLTLQRIFPLGVYDGTKDMSTPIVYVRTDVPKTTEK